MTSTLHPAAGQHAREGGRDLGVVLVHGAWDGPWTWDAVRRLLDGSGIATAVVDLPMTDLASDVEATRRAITELDRPVMLVGHSYGGAVITAAGSHEHVEHLVYLAAFQLAEGESVGRTLPKLDVPGTRLGEALRFADGLDEVRLDPVLGAQLLYSDLPVDAASALISRCRPVHGPVFVGVPDAIAWRSVPSTYVVCADDLAVHPALQRAMAARATHRCEWPCGHSPAATRPEQVAVLLSEIATRAVKGGGGSPRF